MEEWLTKFNENVQEGYPSPLGLIQIYPEIFCGHYISQKSLSTGREWAYQEEYSGVFCSYILLWVNKPVIWQCPGILLSTDIQWQ